MKNFLNWTNNNVFKMIYESKQYFLDATGMVMNMRCLMIPEEFVADHPFIVALVANNSETLDTVLFTGRVYNPIA